MPDENRKMIGRAEKVSFPELGFESVHARIDTGARTSTIWVSAADVRDGSLAVTFFGGDNEHFKQSAVSFTDFKKMPVTSSNGITQHRYVIRLLVKLKGKKIRAWFTLADRSSQVYPVLIGRNVLRGKFIVDVKKGRTLKDAERQRSVQVRAETEQSPGEEEA